MRATQSPVFVSNYSKLFSRRSGGFVASPPSYLDKPGTDFMATIRKDYFPYIAQDTKSRKIKITGVSLAGPDPSLPLQPVNVADTTTLNSKNEFTITVPADLITPNASGTLDPKTDAFLLVSYTLGAS